MASESFQDRCWKTMRDSSTLEDWLRLELLPGDLEQIMSLNGTQEAREILKKLDAVLCYAMIGPEGALCRYTHPADVDGMSWFVIGALRKLYIHPTIGAASSSHYASLVAKTLFEFCKLDLLSLALAGNTVCSSKWNIALWNAGSNNNIALLSTVAMKALAQYLPWRASHSPEPVKELQLVGLNIEPRYYFEALRVPLLSFTKCRFDASWPNPLANDNTTTATIHVDTRFPLDAESPVDILFNFLRFLKNTSGLKKVVMLTKSLRHCLDAFSLPTSEFLNPIKQIDSLQIMVHCMNEEALPSLQILPQLLCTVLSQLPSLSSFLCKCGRWQQDNLLALWRQNGAPVEAALQKHVFLTEFSLLTVDDVASIPFAISICRRNKKLKKVQPFCREIVADPNDGKKQMHIVPLLAYSADNPACVFEVLTQFYLPSLPKHRE